MLKLNSLQDIVSLIDLIKHRPGIYDNTSTEHNNRTNVENLWKEVADEMNATPNDCKRKWASLRNAFSRDLRIERDAELHNRKKKKWYLADHLWFLRNYLTFRPREPKDEENNYTIDENKTFFDNSTQDYSNECLNTDEEEVEVEVKNVTVQLNESKQPTPSTHKMEHRNHMNESPPCTKKSRLIDNLELNERDMTFFKSLIPDILTLSNRRQRLYKQSVLTTLNTFLDEQDE